MLTFLEKPPGALSSLLRMWEPVANISRLQHIADGRIEAGLLARAVEQFAARA